MAQNAAIRELTFAKIRDIFVVNSGRRKSTASFTADKTPIDVFEPPFLRLRAHLSV
jgi:hypothetical protein